TTALRDNGKYVVNGVKHLITNSDFASHFILFAKTADRATPAAVSALLVERDTPGLRIEPLPETMGCRGGEHGRLIFEDAIVAARNGDAGRRIPAEASMCKLFGLEAAGRVTDRALLVHGGLGYTRTFPLERLYRDARLNWLEEGTPTVQQLVIARQLLLDRAGSRCWAAAALSLPSASRLPRPGPTRLC